MKEKQDIQDLQKIIKMIDKCEDTALLRFLAFVQISSSRDITIAVEALNYFNKKKLRRVKK